MNVIYNLLSYNNSPSYYIQHTGPRFKKYALKYNADNVIITRENNIINEHYKKFSQKYQWFNKLLLIEIFLKSNYEKMIFFDNDIVILDNALNLFDLIRPCSFVAGTTEWLGKMTCDVIFNNKKITLDNYTKESLSNQKYVFNSGVMGLDRKAAKLLYEKLFPLDTRKLNEMDEGKSKNETIGDQGIFTISALSIPEINKIILPPYCHTILTKIKTNTSFVHVFTPPKDKNIEILCKSNISTPG